MTSKKNLKIKFKDNSDDVLISLCKSAMQKAVRRGETDKAVKAVKKLIELSPSQASRRVGVVVLEDSILHPLYTELIEIMKRASRKHYVLTNTEKDFLVSFVADLASSEVRDDFHRFIKPIPKELWKKKELSAEEEKLVKAIKYRAACGGMKADMQLLRLYSKVWESRFLSQQPEWKPENLYRFFPNSQIKFNEVGELRKEDVLLETVDNHCSSLLKLLLKKQEVIDLIKSQYPDEQSKLVAQKLLWKMRSGVSFKKQISNGEVVDWFNPTEQFGTEDDRQKFIYLFSKLKGQMNKISLWFLDKTLNK